MNYSELRTLIKNCSDMDFVTASNDLQTAIFEISREDSLHLITEIGIIPEDIGHDSSEEKLYTKVSDILFAKALMEMNFEVQVLRERSNCADIVAQSRYHNYSLVGDAKAFRLSRTAKNAKDFKVESMVHWRGDSNYSVLACPYFQYPKSNSQIYKSALNGNVSLFSWEYLYVMLAENIMESQTINLQNLWNQSAIIAENTTIDDSQKCFIKRQDSQIRDVIGLSETRFNSHFNDIKNALIHRGGDEIRFYEDEILRVKQLNREEAINELLISMKLESKIDTIRKFIEQVQK